MNEQPRFNMSLFVEKLAIIFMWLVVVGGSLLGIGIALMHD